MSMGDRSESKPGKLVEAYRAAVLLRLLTGWGWHRVWRALSGLGYVVSANTMRDWLYRSRKPRFTPTSLEKSLFYHRAYKLALEAKKQHPEWGHKRIATYISKHLPIRVPATTVYYWITGRSKPNITQIRPCPALGYLVGVLVGDYIRAKTGKGLNVKDNEFAEYYTRRYCEVTGVKPDVHLDVRGYCVTYENAGWLRELWYSGLWRVVAYVYPLEFLKGLYDSEGSVTPLIDWEKQRLHYVEVSLAVGNEEVKECAKRILKEHDLEAEENYKPSQLREIKGKKCVFRGAWELRFRGWDKLETFAKLIGFREGERRRRLELLLRLRHLSQRKRFEEWTKHYIKVKGRWVERAPNPRA